MTVLADVVEARLAPDALILLKGSRGVALERLLPLIERDFGQSGAQTTRTEG